MKNIIILFGFLFFLLSSCSKANKSILPNRTNSNNDFPVSRKIIGLYKSDTPYSKFLSKSNCSLYFTSSTSIASEALDHPKHAGVYATALDNNNNDIIQNFQVNDIKLTYQNEEVGYKPTGISKDDLNNQLLGLYGHTVSFESYDNYDTLVVNEKLYIPSYIIMQNIYGDIASTIPKLSVGTQIEWNADASNTNGIAIIVTAMDNTNQKSIENVAFTDDNGSYTISSDLLEGINSGLFVTVDIVRGNLVMVTDKNGLTYKLFAYSSCGQGFTFE